MRLDQKSAWITGFLTNILTYQRTKSIFFIITILGLIIASKLILIGLLGSPVPYNDQWPAEAEQLYIPYLRGQLLWSDLIVLHNDHIIMLTRLTNLAYLELSGNWNPIFQMIANIIFHIIGLILFIRRFSSYFVGKMAAPLLIMFAVLFVLPFSNDNTLSGFQSVFYFVILLSLIGIPLVSESPAMTRNWWMGVVACASTFLAMGAGVGVVLAAALFCALQLAIGVRKRSIPEFVGIILLIGVVVFMLPARNHLPTATPFEFLWGLGLAGGWPVPLPVIGVAIANLPALGLLVVLIRNKETLGAPDWTIIALLLWAGLQASMVAYGRPGGTVTARYFDIYAFIPLLNLIALLALMRRGFPNDKPFLLLAGIGWYAMILGSLMLYAVKFMPIEATMNPLTVAARDENFSTYVRTGDSAVLNKPFQQIPYENPQKLALLTSQPEILGILPARFGAPESYRIAMREKMLLKGGLNLDPDRLRIGAFWFGGLLLALCVGLMGVFIALVATKAPHRRKPGEQSTL